MPAPHASPSRRILEDCKALGRLAQGAPEPARTRLESALGAQLASRLVGGLARRGRAVAP